MGQVFKFTFRILKNTKGFLVSMVIMPILMVILISITLAYSDIPVVGYIGEKAPNISDVKMIKISEDEKDYFLGMSQGSLVVKMDDKGNVEKYYSSMENNPLIQKFEEGGKSEKAYQARPKLSYSIGVILFKFLTASSLLATILIGEKGNGIITRIKSSKTSLGAYILGKCLAIIFVYEIASLVILLFYKFAGFDFGNTSLIQLACLFTLTLIISTGLYLFLAAIMTNEGYIWTVTTGILFPLSLISGVLFPIEHMAEWMKRLAHISPLYYLQSSAISGEIDILAIGIMLVVSMLLAFYAVVKMGKRAY